MTSTVHINQSNNTKPQSIPVPNSTTGEHVTIIPLGSGLEVGRSCILVKFSGHTVMLDCGIHPAKNGYDSLPLFNSDLSDVDLCLVTHFHLDHCGALPYLCEQTNFAGKVYMTAPTIAFFNMVMSDLIKINSPGTSDVVREEWLHATLNRVDRCNYHQEIRHNGIRFQALNAGHVLGAAMFLIEIAGVRILYTGDYSRVPDRHLLAAELPPVSPDILIVESTYGILEHKSTEEREAMFTQTAVDIVKNGGRCLVPVFALGRAQELLLILEEYWESRPDLHHVPIYFASSIAHDCLEQFQTYAGTAMNDRVKKQLDNDTNPFNFRYVKNLTNIKNFDDRGPCVVLASPGMLQSGMSRQLFERWCGRPQNGIIIAGYCIDGTIAEKAKRGLKQIELEDGRTLHVNMQHRLEVSFSAHADVRQTIDFISALPATKHVVLVHGNPQAINNLEDRLTKTFSKSRGLHVYKPDLEEAVNIKFERQRSATLLGSLANRASELLDSSSLLKKNTIQTSSVHVEGVVIQAEDHQLAVVAPDEVSNFSDISLCRDFQQAVVIPMATFRTAQEISNILNSYYANAAWIDRSAFFGSSSSSSSKNKNQQQQQNENENENENNENDDVSETNRRRTREEQEQEENNTDNNNNNGEERLFSVIPLRQQQEQDQKKNGGESLLFANDESYYYFNNNNNKQKNKLEDDAAENNNNNETTATTNQVIVSEIRIGKDVRVIVHEDASNGTTTVTVRWKSHRKSDIMSDVIIAALLLCDSSSTSSNNEQQQQNTENNKSFSSMLSLSTNNNEDAAAATNNNSSSKNQQHQQQQSGKENERMQPADTENMTFRYQCFHRMLRQHFPSVRVNLKNGTAMIVVPSPKNTGQKWHVEIQNWIHPRVLEEEFLMDDEEEEQPDEQRRKLMMMPDSLKRRIGYTLQRIYLAVNPIPFDDKVNDAANGGKSQLLEGGGWCRCGGH